VKTHPISFLLKYFLVIFLILGSAKIEKGLIHGKQSNDLTSNTHQQKRRQTKHFSNRSNKVQRKYSLFKKENLTACIVDETHTIKTWTELMIGNTYPGACEKPFVICSKAVLASDVNVSLMHPIN